MYNESTETKSNGQKTLGTLTTAIKEILDEAKTVLNTVKHLKSIITKKLLYVLKDRIKITLIIQNTIQRLKLIIIKKLLDIQKDKIKIIFVTGPMYAGKSAKLIKKNKEFGKGKVLCCRADLSGREMSNGKDSVTKIRSREYPDISIEAMPLKQNFNAKELVELAINKGCQAIIIDEAQFLSLDSIKDLIHECLKAPNKIEIIFAGLNKDFRGKKFPQSEYLSEIAHETILLTAQCSVQGCKKEATLTAKTGGNINQQIEAGDTNLYKAYCEEHWNEINEANGIITK